MPYTTGDNTGGSATQLDTSFVASFLQDHIDCTRKQIDKFITRRMHLPIHPFVSALDMKERDQSATVKLSPLVDRCPEIGSHFHWYCRRSILKVDVGIDEIEW